jgi:hypothetical protein
VMMRNRPTMIDLNFNRDGWHESARANFDR